MWSFAGKLISSVNVRPKLVNIDNGAFKLHYQITFWGLLLCAAILFSSECFGEKIRCTHSREEDAAKTNEQLDHVINNWCYFMGVFTLPRHHVKNKLNREVWYPGIGPMESHDEPSIKLGWYQWVYYVLFLQACAFYLPHLIWRIQEGRTIHYFVKGLKNVHLLSDVQKENCLKEINKNMYNRMQFYRIWANWLMVCEVLNLINIVVQWFLTDRFLGGNFSKLGTALLNTKNNSFNPLDVAFPKLAKCTYHQFGHTGEMQNVDILCVLSYNVVYEKIYLVLWYWYIILMTVTSIALVHRLLSWLLYNSKLQYNVTWYRVGTTVPADPRDLCLVMESLTYSQWVFLQYLTENLEDHFAEQLVASIADKIREINSTSSKHIIFQSTKL